MPDNTYVTKTYEKDGGDTVVVAAGGKIVVEAGGAIILPTADPHVVGALWASGTTVAISLG